MAKPLEETQASYIAMYNDDVIFDVLGLGKKKERNTSWDYDSPILQNI